MSDVILDIVGSKLVKKWRDEWIANGMDRKEAHHCAVKRWRGNQHYIEERIAENIINLLEKDQFIQRLSDDRSDVTI